VDELVKNTFPLFEVAVWSLLASDQPLRMIHKSDTRHWGMSFLSNSGHISIGSPKPGSRKFPDKPGLG
jgi:hypothetical protein